MLSLSVSQTSFKRVLDHLPKLLVSFSSGPAPPQADPFHDKLQKKTEEELLELLRKGGATGLAAEGGVAGPREAGQDNAPEDEQDELVDVSMSPCISPTRRLNMHVSPLGQGFPRYAPLGRDACLSTVRVHCVTLHFWLHGTLGLGYGSKASVCMCMRKNPRSHSSHYQPHA